MLFCSFRNESWVKQVGKATTKAVDKKKKTKADGAGGDEDDNYKITEEESAAAFKVGLHDAPCDTKLAVAYMTVFSSCLHDGFT